MPEFAQTVTPNVVPARYSPDPQRFESPVTQELRNTQSRMAQGYALKQISYLENQLHLSPYKRDVMWQGASEEAMNESIKILKTARTVMMNEIAQWAGSLNEDELENALPVIWEGYVQQVSPSIRTPQPAAAEAVTPIQVINRPVIPEDAPRSVVAPPEQVQLGDVLAQIEAKSKQNKPTVSLAADSGEDASTDGDVISPPVPKAEDEE